MLRMENLELNSLTIIKLGLDHLELYMKSKMKKGKHMPSKSHGYQVSFIFKVHFYNNNFRNLKMFDIGLTKGVTENLLILQNLNSDYIVKLYDIWLEDDFQFIQMELCRCNLYTFIRAKSTFFSRQYIEPMCETEYFVSWWIWKQLIECIDYIHDQGLIHCDLNSGNILICTNKNGRFIKLAEFSIFMTDYKKLNNTSGSGTQKYKVSRINFGESYYQKDDILRLGLIALELFGIEDNTQIHFEQPYDATNLEKYMMKLQDLITNCISNNYNKRPSAKQILSNMEDYSINDKITNYKKDNLLGLINEYLDSILISTSTQLTRKFKKIELESKLIYKDEDRLSEFTVCERIGNGNYGKVMKVYHNVTKKYYAVKKIYINGKTYLP